MIFFQSCESLKYSGNEFSDSAAWKRRTSAFCQNLHQIFHPNFSDLKIVCLLFIKQWSFELNSTAPARPQTPNLLQEVHHKAFETYCGSFPIYSFIMSLLGEMDVLNSTASAESRTHDLQLCNWNQPASPCLALFWIVLCCLLAISMIN